MIETSHLFRPLGRELISLLLSMDASDWTRPTSAAEWSVRDVAAHLLDVDLRRLSAQRDGHLPPPPDPIDTNDDLVRYLNDLNRAWVSAARRLSPRVLMEELASSTEKAAELFESVDPMAPALFPVAWAGEVASLMWFDVAREYTERWHHQDQIREAVGAAPLAEREWLRPVLDTSLLALPHAYGGVEGPDGTCVALLVAGAGGGAWSLVRRDGAWQLNQVPCPEAASIVEIEDLQLARLLLHRLTPEQATTAVEIRGSRELGRAVLNVRAVMV